MRFLNAKKLTKKLSQISELLKAVITILFIIERLFNIVLSVIKTLGLL